jgi:hypothetical protein
MQFSRLFVAAAAVAGANAALNLTVTTYAGITVGQPFVLTWGDNSGPVSLILLDDTDPNNVKPFETLGSMFPLPRPPTRALSLSLET